MINNELKVNNKKRNFSCPNLLSINLIFVTNSVGDGELSPPSTIKNLNHKYLKLDKYITANFPHTCKHKSHAEMYVC